MDVLPIARGIAGWNLLAAHAPWTICLPGLLARTLMEAEATQMPMATDLKIGPRRKGKAIRELAPHLKQGWRKR